MLEILINLLSFSGIAILLVGLLVVFHVMKGKKLPMDESNRINHARLVWWAVTKPEKFVKWFLWLENDEGDNLK